MMFAIVQSQEYSIEERKAWLDRLFPEVFGAFVALGVAIWLVGFNAFLTERKVVDALSADVEQTLEVLEPETAAMKNPLLLVLPSMPEPVAVRAHIVFPVGIIEAAKSGLFSRKRTTLLLRAAVAMEGYSRRSELLLGNLVSFEPQIQNEKLFLANLSSMFLDPLEESRREIVVRLNAIRAEFSWKEAK